MSSATDEPGTGPLNPLRLTIEHAARILSSASGRVISAEQIRRDVLHGAPTNADGTLSLVHYAAWLVKEMGRGE